MVWRCHRCEACNVSMFFRASATTVGPKNFVCRHRRRAPEQARPGTNAAARHLERCLRCLCGLEVRALRGRCLLERWPRRSPSRLAVAARCGWVTRSARDSSDCAHGQARVRRSRGVRAPLRRARQRQPRHPSRQRTRTRVTANGTARSIRRASTRTRRTASGAWTPCGRAFSGKPAARDAVAWPLNAEPGPTLAAPDFCSVLCACGVLSPRCTDLDLPQSSWQHALPVLTQPSRAHRSRRAAQHSQNYNMSTFSVLAPYCGCARSTHTSVPHPCLSHSHTRLFSRSPYDHTCTPT